MLRFFNLNYYFSLNPLIDSVTLKIMLAVFVAMVVCGLGIKIYEKIKDLPHIEEKLLDKYFAMLVVMGFLGILIAWFRYESAYLFSARFWLLLWGIGLIFWFVKILIYQFKVVPKAKKQAEQKKIFTKYLPKRK